MNKSAKCFLRRCLAILVVATLSATAMATVYNVDRAVGPGRVVGTIETNGTTGILSEADFVDWNLSVDADGMLATTADLLGPLSGNNSSVFLGTGAENPSFTATPDGLFFDFSMTIDLDIFQISGSQNDVVWQLQAHLFQDELLRESQGNQSFVLRDGSQQIAVAVPEPATVTFLFALAILPIGIRRFRQSNQASLSKRT